MMHCNVLSGTKGMQFEPFCSEMSYRNWPFWPNIRCHLYVSRKQGTESLRFTLNKGNFNRQRLLPLVMNNECKRGSTYRQYFLTQKNNNTSKITKTVPPTAAEISVSLEIPEVLLSVLCRSNRENNVNEQSTSCIAMKDTLNDPCTGEISW